MPEKALLPVTVTRAPGEITVEMNPEDLIGFRQEDEQVTRVNVNLDGENVAILQKFPGGHAMTESLPDITQEEASRFIEAAMEMREGGDLRARIEAALDGSTGRCARCKVCSIQADAVMAALGYPPENAN